MSLFEKYKYKLINEFLDLKKKSKNSKDLELIKINEEIVKVKKIFEDLSDGDNILSYLTEENINKKNSQESNLALKDSEKKIASLNTSDNENKGVKYEYEGDDEEIHTHYEIKNGMEMIEYDREPSDKFKERMTNSIKGSSETGNNGFSGDSEDFKKAHDQFSDDFIKTTKSSKQKRDNAKVGIISMGDDIETTNKKVSNRSIGLKENKKEEKINDMRTIKRLIFERTFTGKEDAIKRIPENFKNDNNTFLLTDRNETYKVRWEGDLNEGQAVILSYENKLSLNEEFSKMDELINYSSKKANSVAKTSKDDADKTLFEMMDIFKGKNVLSENLNTTDDIENMNADSDYEKAFDSMEGEDVDEAFGDMFRSYDKIFMRDNKSDIEAVKSIPDGDEKNAKAKEILAKANQFIKEKGIESGSATSLKNEIKRAMGYKVSLRGGQS